MPFETEYWERHYKSGGSSGEGSVGKNREWKWYIINSYVNDLDDVIDIGCGDLSFWENRKRSVSKRFRYFGLDISHTMVERNRTRFPSWTFNVGDASAPVPDIKGRIVLCLDVLFHVMDDGRYLRILENLARYSLEWIFVFTWCRTPFDFRWRLRYLRSTKHATWRRIGQSRPSPMTYLNLIWSLIKPRQLFQDTRFLAYPTESDGVYETYRRFEDYIGILENHGFALVGKHQNPYYKQGAMYVFHTHSSAHSASEE